MPVPRRRRSSPGARPAKGAPRAPAAPRSRLCSSGRGSPAEPELPSASEGSPERLSGRLGAVGSTGRGKGAELRYLR